ncbi:MAG TPA: hypothetical protein VGL94_04830, partial [Ktedonobacteraceae bacterium]|jgi:hypothetical protein
MPTMTVARFTLWSYIRSGWILGDLIFVCFLYTFFFLESSGNVSYFYGTIGQGLGILAIVDTVVIVQRSLKTTRLYLPLAHLSSRSDYIRGLILATAILRIVLFLLILLLDVGYRLLVLLLAAGYHRAMPMVGIQEATFANMLPGAIGLLLNCIILSTLTVVLSAPVATRLIQIGFLIWLAAVLYANNNANIVAHYLAISHIPLIPLLSCYDLGLTASVDSYGLVMIVLAVVYIIGLTWLADFWLSRRDLILW